MSLHFVTYCWFQVNILNHKYMKFIIRCFCRECVACGGNTFCQWCCRYSGPQGSVSLTMDLHVDHPDSPGGSPGSPSPLSPSGVPRNQRQPHARIWPYSTGCGLLSLPSGCHCVRTVHSRISSRVLTPGLFCALSLVFTCRMSFASLRLCSQFFWDCKFKNDVFWPSSQRMIKKS